mmetsp:Transcript_32620/g.74452  ORF Transcript_32620/g.74452 Transcript_32620/m.74452 type:complete len:87 (+) Transcript_32620:224-484(+)
MVAMVDTATCWGIIHVRRQAWVEVEPALCDTMVCGILTRLHEKKPGKPGKEDRKKRTAGGEKSHPPGDGRIIINVCRTAIYVLELS